MGYQDREYYRETSQGGAVESLVVKLIILNGAIFLADILFGGRRHALSEALMLRGEAIAHPWMWYQFLTAGFVHDPSNPLHIVFNMFGLYYFGRPLEERFGKRYFLCFYLTAIVAGFVVYSARAYFLHDPVILHARDGAELRAWGACYGASGGVTAAIVLFCLLYPRTTLLLFFAIPTPAWLVGILVVATDLFGAQSQNTGRVAYDVHLVGAAIAFGTWYFRWNFARWPDGSGLARMFAAPQRWLQLRPALRVHEPDEEYEDLDAEADRLLEKVGREGQGSLTPRERRILEDYSRRIRQKLR